MKHSKSMTRYFLAIAALLVAAPSFAQDTEALDGAMGDVEWGWTQEQLLEHFENVIRAEHRDEIRGARDAMAADAANHRMQREIQRMRSSVVEFDGTRTGHDSSYLRGEFTHNNSESVIRVRRPNSDDYYFFIRGRLWKWYRAFDAAVFRGADFEQFAEALGNRFGSAGEFVEDRLHMAENTTTWYQWESPATRARAMDKTAFYGFYCLVLEDKSTLARLDDLRTVAPQRGDQGHSLVDAVLRSNNEEAEEEEEAEPAPRRRRGRR